MLPFRNQNRPTALPRAGTSLRPSHKRISMPANEQPRALSGAQIEQFIRDGFVRVERVFSQALAAAGRAILWRDLPCAFDDPASWTRPVVRLGEYHDEPFERAVNSPLLHAALDQLVGEGR